LISRIQSNTVWHVHAAPIGDLRRLAQRAYRSQDESAGRGKLTAELGNFGDCKPVGEGASEMRVDVGAGYRIYFVREGASVFLLLVGGDKGSQKWDIQQAKAVALELKESRR
jgi:putative addiction module killer protein